MKRLTGFLTLVCLFAAGAAQAIDFEPWVYPKLPATPTAGAYPSTLHIVAVPNTTAGAAVHIPGDLLVTTTGTQNITGKTYTAPIFNGSISGTFAFSLAPTITAFAGGGARCIEATNTGLLTVAASPCGTGSGGGGPAVEYVADVTGTNTYVAATVTPSGFTAIQNYRFCGWFANANTGPSTLNVLSSGAFAINTQSSAGLAPLVKGEIGPNHRLCFQLASATGPWVLQTLPFGHVTRPAAGTTVVSGPQWASGETFDISVAGVNLSIPPANTLPPNGGIVIKTTGVTATATPDSGDGIKTGVGPSTPGIAAQIPEGSLSLLTSTGVAGVDAFTLPTGPVQYYSLTWGPAQNLATVPLPIGGFQTPRVITGVNCIIAAIVGGSASLDVWAADYSVTAANVTTSGTKLNGAAACNANTLTGVPGSFQGLTVASASVAANSQLWLVATGSAWSASTGVGKFQVGYK